MKNQKFYFSIFSILVPYGNHSPKNYEFLELDNLFQNITFPAEILLLSNLLLLFKYK